MKKLITAIFLISTSAAFAIECSQEDLQKLDLLKSDAHETISRIISEAKTYDSTKVQHLDKVIETLECMESKIPQVSFKCKETVKNHPNALGSIDIKRSWNLKKTYSTYINLYPMFLSRVSVLKVGTIVHEVSHMCATEDLDYYGGDMDERNLEVNNYSINYIQSESITSKQIFASPITPLKKYYKNADTYRMWASNVFCIPGEDCYEKIIKSRKNRAIVNIRDLVSMKKYYPISEESFNSKREYIRKELHELYDHEKVLTELEIEELLKPLY